MEISFHISLNIVSNILLQADAIKQGTDFSPVHSFANNLRYANF